MTRQMRQILIGVVAGLVIAVIAFAVTRAGDDTSGIDKSSYLAGYHDSFADSLLEATSESRGQIEAECDGMYRERWVGSGPRDIDRHSWVTGCADYVQNKDSRFG
ncbi:hypothetical protein ACFT38_28260 [Streptomyces sp. NPDC056975]|uniref:hypothetical protein n=1 Tax=Streptomyces sp. NPDC056975 TaxID=3345985 RepID=UPI003642DA47